MSAPALQTLEAQFVEADGFRAEWWRCLFDDSDDAQVVCLRSGTIHEANRKATLLLGLDIGGAEALCLKAAVSSATWRSLHELLRRSPPRRELLSGVTVLSQGRISGIADLQVTPLSEGHFLLTFKDASRRWRMESHVQRLVTAIDATPDVFFLTDADFRLTFVNAAFQSVTGHTIEEALGHTADFLRAPGQAALIREYLDCVRQGRDWTGELVNVRADGSTYTVAASVAPVFDRVGDLLGYVSNERDITASKRLQDEVLLERNFARSIVDSIDSAIYTVDRHFRITHINEGWKKLPPDHGWLRITAPPQPGAALLDFVPDEAKRAELEGLFEMVLVTREAKEMQGASGRHHWSVKMSPWLHAGEVIGLIYHVVDQTQFHELQMQLHQAHKMETVGALAAGVAHDFNNLLQAIQGNVSLLSGQELDGTARNRVQQIAEASSRASSITQQLLSFSRVSEENLAVFDFNSALEETVRLVRRSARGNIEILIGPSPTSATVRMDATRAQQLLLNLCVNAQDAMPDGGRLTLTNRRVALNVDQAVRARVPAGTLFVRCSIEDTGTGISPDNLARIFDPFFTTKQPGKGTGLGLAIVQSVATQAGGFVVVESVIGKGTTFQVYLPFVDAEPTVTSTVAPTRSRRGSGRVLVVDDVDLIREFSRDYLGSAGFTVTVVKDAQDALELLETDVQPFDLVLTDYNMPGMNGVELIERTTELWPAMRFILASGYLDDEYRSDLEALDHVSVLRKPYQMHQAVDLIMEMLATAR